MRCSACDGARMRGGPKGRPFDMDTAAGLRAGVEIAFVRMGLTRDVARLASGKTPIRRPIGAPEHLEESWVRRGVGGRAQSGARPPNAVEHGAFSSTISEPADETLWLDAARWDSAAAGGSSSTSRGRHGVGEDYDEFAIDSPVPDEAFRIVP